MSKILKAIRQAFCEHEFHTLYLDSRFHTEREALVHHWVCKCKKCGKIIRVRCDNEM